MDISLDEIRKRFHGQGLKMTPQRAAIYRVLAESTSHPTAEDLYRTVRAQYPLLSPNTVYYTLGALREAGLVREVNYWHDRARYDANMAPHHHLICLGCRRIQDLTDATLDCLTVCGVAKAGFRVMGHRVEFHGYCAACRQRPEAGKPIRHFRGERTNSRRLKRVQQLAAHEKNDHEQGRRQHHE